MQLDGIAGLARIICACSVTRLWQWGLRAVLQGSCGEGRHRNTFSAACRRLVYACADTPEDAMACGRRVLARLPLLSTHQIIMFSTNPQLDSPRKVHLQTGTVQEC